MVVHSGGKSLHAMFEASDDEEVNWQFMNLAVKYGRRGCIGPNNCLGYPTPTDSLLDRRIQADENRNKIRQECLYLDPK